MKGRTMTNTEYLLRTTRESERMLGWKDTFSNMREEIKKEFFQKQKEDIFEKNK